MPAAKAAPRSGTPILRAVMAGSARFRLALAPCLWSLATASPLTLVSAGQPILVILFYAGRHRRKRPSRSEPAPAMTGPILLTWAQVSSCPRRAADAAQRRRARHAGAAVVPLTAHEKPLPPRGVMTGAAKPARSGRRRPGRCWSRRPQHAAGRGQGRHCRDAVGPLPAPAAVASHSATDPATSG
jgi:hypothetical protein